MEANSIKTNAYPPARIDPVLFAEHGRARIDPYHWLRHASDPEVRQFLLANNRHAAAAMRHTAGLQKKIFAELRALVPADEGAPEWRLGDFYYRFYFGARHEHPLFARRAARPGAVAEVLLDGNRLAAGHAFFALEGIQVSPQQDLLAFAADTRGSRSFALRFLDMARRRLLPDILADVDSSCAWADDNRTIFYVRLEPKTLRPYRVCRHRLGCDPARDEIVFEETDPSFRCLIFKSRSQRMIILNSFADQCEEARFLDARNPCGRFTVFCPRQAGHEYELDHDGAGFVVRTNLDAPGFRVCAAPARATSPEFWRELAPARSGCFIERVAVFRGYLALLERRAALTHLRVIERAGGTEHEVVFPEPAYELWLENIPGINTDTVRLGYTSLATPVSFYDYNMARRVLTLVSRENVPGYESARYVVERHWARSHDGARVPISLVRRRGRARPAPLLLFGYGAYGSNIPTFFDQSRLALLERGFVYAMAHVRGGSELGPDWYARGRLRNKANTFADFIACADFLADSGLARRGALFAESLSAGGLLLGAVINMRPDLFRGVVAQAPFVDLLSTMTDHSLPLTAFEYAEWGNPRREADWRYMRAYSPCDNIRPAPYPHVLATANWHDGQVPFWEPAKWVSGLRAANTANTRIILKTNMHAGHSGTAGRLRRLRDLAFIYAFLIDLAEKSVCVKHLQHGR